MEAQKLPPITTNRERTSSSSWPHQKILLVITRLPECGIVLNRCIANRFFHLGSTVTKHEPRYLCTCKFFCRSEFFRLQPRAPPLFATTKHLYHSLLPLISLSRICKSRFCSRIARRSATQLNCPAQLPTTYYRTRRPFDPYISSATV